MRRLAVVAVVAVAGFVAAFVAFGDAARRNCVIEARPDAAYGAEFVQPVAAGTAAHVLAVRRGGEPVVGAWVCVRVQAAGTGGPGLAAEAREVAPGRYEVLLGLTPGRWEGVALIDESGGAGEVAAAVTVDVDGTPGQP